MEWSPALIWLALALLLGLAELTSGALLLLALAIAATLTAAVATLEPSLAGQLLAMGAFSGVLVPLAVWKIRPWFSPRGVAYGTTGSGIEKGRRYTTLEREFDGATGIKINGDFYRLRVAHSSDTELPAGTPVIFERFDGTTAVVHLAPPAAPQDKEQ
ncbi:NfeD family protein [Billgrantia gudaonensis]|uniref:Membrane protein implicated in regulation of membrane protease activity n=1 Tax=Billgrantia gudaonensis TaxID=376427 RepID=A0A1G9A551_9GAMM|nr:NfeD family protein [Halomonas gudaonensis]SDK21715.1 Membrane protein implicated in regulation of membrane protease activity [Halomonas gudaonensis]